MITVITEEMAGNFYFNPLSDSVIYITRDLRAITLGSRHGPNTWAGMTANTEVQIQSAIGRGRGPSTQMQLEEEVGNIEDLIQLAKEKFSA